MKNPSQRVLVACVALLSAMALILCGCTGTQQTPAQEEDDEQVYPVPVFAKGQDEQSETLMRSGNTYRLADTHTVDGRQGIAWADGAYFVSGSTTLSRYDAAWNLEKTNDDPFAGIDAQVNHLGDIDAYDGKVYAGVENFVDGEASNIQIVVYDAETLEPLEAFPFEPESGQTEVSGIAVDPDHGSVWMCSWADGESGRYLYRYDLESGDYLGKVHLQAPPQWIQGVAYHDGWLYITADDGTADDGEPDHVWRCKVDLSRSAWHVSLERTLDDVELPGEVEGVSFNQSSGQMLVSYNRGAHIVLGMPKGFYEGYDEEVHEVYVYDAESASAASAAGASTAGAAAPTSSEAGAEAPAPDAEVDDVTTVAYLGPEGTYTEEAAKLFFGDNDELMPQDTVADALKLVADGTAAYAVVPQENAIGGPVTDYIDAFLDADGVSVVGEVVLPIRQTLMGLPGTDLAQVKRVLSHKQGLAQSSAWLDENLPSAERVEAASTAAAAQEVAEGNDTAVVAIAAPGAAELYGLEVLQENVSQSDTNKTRFYVVSRQSNELVGYERAAFKADIAAADLPGVLNTACVDGSQLVCVHDRPEGSALGTYRYVIELARDTGFTDEEIARLADTTGLEYLGRYACVEG